MRTCYVLWPGINCFVSIGHIELLTTVAVMTKSCQLTKLIKKQEIIGAGSWSTANYYMRERVLLEFEIWFEQEFQLLGSVIPKRNKLSQSNSIGA